MEFQKIEKIGIGIGEFGGYPILSELELKSSVLNASLSEFKL